MLTTIVLTLLGAGLYALLEEHKECPKCKTRVPKGKDGKYRCACGAIFR